MEELDFVLEYLLNERQEKIDLKSMSFDEKKDLYQTLSNLREPGNEVSNEYLDSEKIFLGKILDKKDQVSLDQKYKIQDKIYLIKGDITSIKADAIVNAANSAGLGCFIPRHKCIDNVIHTNSGIMLREECYQKMKKIKTLEVGKAFLTKGYNLPSKYVIHTVGPIVGDKVTDKEKVALKSCYISSLEIAEKKEIKSVVFPCISTGMFHFPKDIACEVAINACKEYLKNNKKTCIEKIVFNTFEDEDYNIYKEKLSNKK